MLRARIMAGGIAAALMAALSGAAVAAPQDYRFEIVQVRPAGPGAPDVSVRLVNVRDGSPMTGAIISESTVDMAPSGMKGTKGSVTLADTDGSGIYHFRARTSTSGPWALHLAAEVPGEARIERTYIPTAKVTYTRTVRGQPEVVRGTVTFGAK
ncbi:FixH family protein [Vineibacter terrae]|nr:FixH family protein [Vineibacter terrae]